jgi:Fe-S cluster assembly protein SufD
MEQDSHLTWLTAILGANTGRIESETVLTGTGASVDHRTLHLATQHDAVHLVDSVIHEAASSTSELTVRSAVGGTAYTRYEGKIVISPGSQQTSGKLDEKTLFLSNSAKHDSVPGLEIDADDVKATHASAISKIDEEQLFYCQSRGIAPREATALIIDGMLRSLGHGLPDSMATLIDTHLTPYLDAAV